MVEQSYLLLRLRATTAPRSQLISRRLVNNTKHRRPVTHRLNQINERQAFTTTQLRVGTRPRDHPLTATQAVTVPPVIAVATSARTYRARELVTTTVLVVLAAVVLTAEPSEYQFTLSRLPCSCTEPAKTPAEVVTTII
jgi:hypothetical protein